MLISNYCDVLSSSILDLGGGKQARAEKILIRSTGVEELRFSWRTQNGTQFQRAPLDLPEDQWIKLFNIAVKNNILSQEFIKEMIKTLAKELK